MAIESVVIRAPAPEDRGEGGMLRLLQVVSPIAGAGTGLVFLVAYRQSPLLLLTMGMAIGIGVLISAAGAMAQWLQTRRRRRAVRERYLAYLRGEEERIRRWVAGQEAGEELWYPRPADLLELAARRDRVYPRLRAAPEWLHVRAGSGLLPSPLTVRIEDIDPLAVPPDPRLLAAAQALAGRWREREDAPVTISLASPGCVSVRGELGRSRGVVRALVLQAALFHAPEDLGIALQAEDEEAAGSWDWMKWLPHTRTRRTPAAHGEGGGAGRAAERHLLVVRDGRPASGDARRTALDGLPMPATILCVAGATGPEPEGVRARLTVDAAGVAVLQSFGDEPPAPLRFQPDEVDAVLAERIARALSPLHGRGGARENGSRDAPATLSQALRIGGATPAEIAGRWGGAPPGLLPIPIGLTPEGERIDLDIRQAAEGGMGPHGMLVGATGSGKSELLRTVVAGLALSHPPSLLALVLVDFKGGAAFQPYAGLPHVAGVVTNLEDEPTMVERLRLAVQGELTRRQRLLKGAGSVADIRDYRRLQATDARLEPLPYLLLVVDELAELLSHFPDFDAFFEQVARLGRGLGVHLLLATQGLSAGLNKLERHLSYRLCLRTNSAQESLALLGTPRAAQLPLRPGAGFLKVGARDPQQFRAFLVGGGPRDEVDDEEPRSGPVRDLVFEQEVKVTLKVTSRDAKTYPSRRALVGSDGNPEPGGEPSTDGVVELIAALGARRVHPVWLPPLPPAIPLDAVLHPGGDALRIGLGLADHPAEQRQSPWGLDLAGSDGHVAVVGAPRSGRSTALRSIAAALLTGGDPRLVQVYVVDMGGALHGLSAAPHVGGVLGKDEPEVVRRLLRLLQRLAGSRDGEIRERRMGGIGELRRSWREQGSRDGHGDVFLMVDNWGAACRAFPWLDDEVTGLATIGLSYGIHLVLSADRWADVRAALRDRIPARIQLRPLDPGDSAFDLRSTRALTPVPGRALVSGGLQVQLALPRMDGEPATDDVEEAFRLCIAGAVPGPRAPSVPLLPTTVPMDSFDWDRWRAARTVPIGISDVDLQPVTLDLFASRLQHLLLCGAPRCGKSSFLRAYMAAMTRVFTPQEVRFHVVDVRRALLDAVPDAYLAAHALSVAAVGDLVGVLGAELERRTPPAAAGRRELAARCHIHGPELVLIVDDDDLLDVTALRPLAGVVAHAWDRKFHVVMARRPVPPAYDSLVSALLGTAPAALEMSESDRAFFVPRPVLLPAGRAHLVADAEPILVQLIHAGSEP